MNTLGQIPKTDDITVIGISDQSRIRSKALAWMAEANYPVEVDQKFDREGLIDLRRGDQGIPLVLMKAKGVKAIAQKRLLLGKNFPAIITGTDTATEVALMEDMPIFQVLKTAQSISRFGLMTSQSSSTEQDFTIMFTKYPEQAKLIAQAAKIKFKAIQVVESDAEILAGSIPNSVTLDIIESGGSRDDNNLREIAIPESLNAIINLQMGGFELERTIDLPSPIQKTMEDLWQRLSGEKIERELLPTNF